MRSARSNTGICLCAVVQSSVHRQKQCAWTTASFSHHTQGIGSLCSRLLGAGSRLDVCFHTAGDDVVCGRKGGGPVSMMGASQALTSDQPAIAAAAAAQHGAAASPLHPAAEVVCLAVRLDGSGSSPSESRLLDGLAAVWAWVTCGIHSESSPEWQPHCCTAASSCRRGHDAVATRSLH